VTIIPQPDQYTVDIHFRGICTHFHSNILPGIPHRVVLPDATMILPGLLTGPSSIVPVSNDPLDWLMYCLMPHFPSITMVDAAVQSLMPPMLGVDGVVQDGLIYTSSHLSIANAVQTSVSYPPPYIPTTPPPPGSFFAVPQLTSFVPHYTYSTDVVLGGRAAAYFDLYGGEIVSFQDGGSLRVRARVITDGPPQLRITPLAVLDQPVPVQVIPLTTDSEQLHSTMIVSNSGSSCISADYDFLLHYLTSAAGIPRALVNPVPGMPLRIEDIAKGLNVAEVLKATEELLKNKWMPPVEFFDLQASCSDSRYP
jgi:hypothetical protein